MFLVLLLEYMSSFLYYFWSTWLVWDLLTPQEFTMISSYPKIESSGSYGVDDDNYNFSTILQEFQVLHNSLKHLIYQLQVTMNNLSSLCSRMNFHKYSICQLQVTKNRIYLEPFIIYFGRWYFHILLEMVCSSTSRDEFFSSLNT